MSSVSVEPQSGGECTAVVLGASVFIRLLDAVTGQPVKHAYADRVTVTVNGNELNAESNRSMMMSALERRGQHPFRVQDPRAIKLRPERRSDWGKEFIVPIHCLRVFTWPQGGERSVTDEYVPEFFDAAEGGGRTATIADHDNRFVSVSSDDRWVCVQSGSKCFARRDLITNDEGVLEIPARCAKEGQTVEYEVHFRDHVCLPAVGWNAGNSLDGRVSLVRRGNAADSYRWRAAVGDGDEVAVSQFDDVAKVRFEPAVRETEPARTGTIAGLLKRGWRVLLEIVGRRETGTKAEENGEAPEEDEAVQVDATFWVMRRVKDEPDGARPQVPGGRRRKRRKGEEIRGIIIHYNSGWRCQYEGKAGAFQERGSPGVLSCKEELKSRDNEFLWHPLLPHRLLRRLLHKPSGYHYIIDRSGTIWVSAPEEQVTWHSGGPTARLPENVGVLDLIRPMSDPETQSIDMDEKQRTIINTWYIGIALIGFHEEPVAYFTDAQHWYLDRLIENIRGGRSGIPWYRIFGHDEVDLGDPTIPRDPKEDPGAALNGGMVALRGTHRAYSDPGARDA